MIQDKGCIDFNQGEGQAVREYTTDSGPADYVLFLDRKPVGITEAKKETLGHHITTVEDQTKDYADDIIQIIREEFGAHHKASCGAHTGGKCTTNPLFRLE